MTFAAPEFSEFTGEVATFGSGTARNEYNLVSVKIHLHVHYLISKYLLYQSTVFKIPSLRLCLGVHPK